VAVDIQSGIRFTIAQGTLAWQPISCAKSAKRPSFLGLAMHDRLQDGKVDGYINTPDVLSTLHKNLVNFAFGNHLRRQISKIKKSPYLSNGLTDRRKILAW